MSFLTRTITSRTIAATAPASRIAAVRTSRTFTTSSPIQKTPAETVKDGLKTVDRAVSDKLVDGIDLASAAGSKVKETAEKISKTSAAEKAEELRGKAKGTAEELKGKAKGTAEEAKGKLNGTTEEVKGFYD